MEYKYVAYYADDHEFETFKTFEDAEKWLKEYDEQDGFSDGTENSYNFIAKITHISIVVKTDEKKNYHVHTDDCNENCDKEEWPYNDEFNYVYNVKYMPVKDNIT